jgi:hypothetical protein
MAATVRSPGARSAPIKSTRAHSHTRSTIDLFKMAQHVYNLGRHGQHLFFFLEQNFESSFLCLSFFVYRLDKV